MSATPAGTSCAVEDNGDSPAKAQRDLQSFRSEYDLERAINAATIALGEGQTRAEKMQRWRELCRLIDQRTPARRRFMERMRGLT